MPDAKGKKDANRMAQEWLAKLNAEADLMSNAGRAKTVDEIYKEYLMRIPNTLHLIVNRKINKLIR